jgi:hypothetical protein
MERLHISRQPRERAVAVVPSEGGVLEVWERPRPLCRYLLTVRGGGMPVTIGGKQERERSVLMVLRKWYEEEEGGKIHPTRLVCRLRPPALLDPTPLAELTGMVADWYGDALTFVEIKDGPLLAKECQRLYVAVQTREVLDKATSVFSKDLGWETDEETGPAALNALVNAIRETGLGAKGDPRKKLQVECEHVLGELATFAGDSAAAPVNFEDDVRTLATGLYNIDSATLLKAETRPKVAPRDGWRTVESFR